MTTAVTELMFKVFTDLLVDKDQSMGILIQLLLKDIFSTKFSASLSYVTVQ